MTQSSVAGARCRQAVDPDRAHCGRRGEAAASHRSVLDDVHKTYEAPIQMSQRRPAGHRRLGGSTWTPPSAQPPRSPRGSRQPLCKRARFQAPFDVIPIFVSNKQPSELADEAFLRRIRYKVEIPPPSAGLFHEILRRECERNEVAYDEAAAQYLVDEHFTKLHRKMRGCHPRDIVESIAAAAAYRGTPRVLSQTTIDEACANYFV